MKIQDKIKAIFDNWDNNDPNINERYRQKPTKDEMTGFPSEFSRLTGLSFSIFFDIDAKK